MRIERFFSKEGVHPFDEHRWSSRDARITGSNGETIFEKSIEAPEQWSDMACRVVASKYLGKDETSVKDLIRRVCCGISGAGLKSGYFTSLLDENAFEADLIWLCLNQYGSFNSPVWFNVGLQPKPQVSACFIQSVEDNMDSIMQLAVTEANLFKHGSGTGTDLSSIRSSKERLSSGGRPSGPLSFMRVYDQIAAVVKSGGKTRRAAKMQSLRVDHPDILEFIECKEREDRKARDLVAAGWGPEAYDTVAYQNANLSVRVTDEFMKALDPTWPNSFYTKKVTTGHDYGFINPRDLFRRMAECAHACGDPGIQYHDTINRWHTCPESGSINASNPCSEYMFLDDSACNLASLNLMKFRNPDGSFNVEAFKHAVRIFIIAQDILVDLGSYPTPSIETNSWRFRPLGLGFANLGALVMSNGLPYDSDDARSLAGSIAALMTGQAYLTSAEIAEELGEPQGLSLNRTSMKEVLEDHHNEVLQRSDDSPMWRAAVCEWSGVPVCDGFRNAQVTCIAPTGTIGFMMDCDTTGIEPVLALSSVKHLAGGWEATLVPQCVELVKERINSGELTKDVVACAMPAPGMPGIPYMAHLKMMAAVQPFISGAISKTINMPATATVEDVENVFMEGWKLGLKSVTVYRDGSKQFQPVSTGPRPASEDKAQTQPDARIERTPARRRLPETRDSVTHKFNVAKHEGYITVGLYEDGTPGEMFITMTKAGSTLGGLMDCFATSVSLNLQYGVPLESMVKKFRHVRFEPAGMTGSKDIPFAKSIVDYVFTWLGRRFLPGTTEVAEVKSAPTPTTAGPTPAPSGDAPPCDVCGSLTVRNGTCFKCPNCGNSLGCS